MSEAPTTEPPSAAATSTTHSSIWGRSKALVISSPWSFALFLTRVLLVLSAFKFVLSSGISAYTAYKYVMTFGMASSIMRCGQRVGRPTLTSNFVSQLAVEDSFHYLVYSIIMGAQPPSLPFMAPLVIFAVFAMVPYIDKITPGRGRLHQILGNISTLSDTAFRLAATIEIAVLLILFCRCIASVVSLDLTRVLRDTMVFLTYLQFTQLRYCSRRNPRPRAAWAGIHSRCETIFRHQYCPGFVTALYRKVAGGIEGMMKKIEEQAAARVRS